jgi:hypothetical protein
MNKRIVLLALCIIIASVGSAQKYVLNSAWRDSIIVIDGNPTDWEQPFPYFDSKAKLQYSVVNDAQYVYISIKTNDPKAQMKIMRAGMDITFDVTGKKKEVSTIHYPLKSNPKLDITQNPDELDQQTVEKPDIRKMQLEWSMSTRDIHTQGFKGIPTVVTEADSGKYGIRAAINWDRGDAMTFEIRVPFSAFFKEALTAADTLKPITVTIKANAMDLPLIPTTAANSNTDVTGSAMGNGMNNAGMNNGMPNTMGNNTRPQTSSPQPSMAIPKTVADMGVPLVVSMRLKLAFR